jgi:hypothetical protein
MSFEFFGSGDRTVSAARVEQLSLAICAVQVDPEVAKSFENLILAGAITG